MEQEAGRSNNPFSDAPIAAQPTPASAVATSDQSRAVAEVQAAMLIAQRFPRNEVEAMDKILNAFTRTSLAEVAQYQYAKGGSDVRGPSIRSAEAIAQLWGHINSGVRELDRRNGVSTVETFAFDAQTGTRDSKVFQVEHTRHTKKGSYKLEDPREIYEMVANQAARRKRACLLAVIPGDVVEAAMKQADVTLHTKAEVTPERLASLVEKFSEFAITKEQIETRIQRRIDVMSPAQLVNLGKIYNSLRDGMSQPADWFEITAATETETEAAKGTRTDAVKDALKKKTASNADPKLEANAKPINTDVGGAQVTVIDAIAALDGYKDSELMALYADQLPETVKSDDRFTKKYRARMGELKEEAGKKK